jgi:hypothetical protein
MRPALDVRLNTALRYLPSSARPNPNEYKTDYDPKRGPANVDQNIGNGWIAFGEECLQKLATGANDRAKQKNEEDLSSDIGKDSPAQYSKNREQRDMDGFMSQEMCSTVGSGASLQLGHKHLTKMSKGPLTFVTGERSG